MTVTCVEKDVLFWLLAVIWKHPVFGCAESDLGRVPTALH